MFDKNPRKLWDRLRRRKLRYQSFLNGIDLSGIGDIGELRVNFTYPVSVIAGDNADWKSSVLFAAACAYKAPDAGPREFAPSTFFSGYRPKHEERKIQRPKVAIDFGYSTPNGRRSMRWGLNKSWSRSYFGRRGAGQPERCVYFRTLGNFSNPSGARSLQSLPRLNSAPLEIPLTPAQIELVLQMLLFRYSEVIEQPSESERKKRLLYSVQKSAAFYSELDLAAGERAILSLTQEIARLHDALILIDEIESGLHPRVLKLLMFQLQQLALRNDLQIILTTHSSVVMESVPLEARIFLERDESGRVFVYPIYRDVIPESLSKWRMALSA